jgi:hypothetical protein
MAYQHSEIIDVAPAHFSSLWLRIGTFIALCGSLFSPQNAFIIRSLSDHQIAQLSAMNAPMHSRNAKKCARTMPTISLCRWDICTPVSLNFAFPTCF